MGEKNLRSKDDQVKKLENSLKLKDDQIMTLERSLQIKDDKAKTLEKTIELLNSQNIKFQKKKIKEAGLGLNGRTLNFISGEQKIFPILFPEKDLARYLNPKQVLVILREDLKRIYIWKGAESPVKKRFLSSQVAQELLREERLDPRYHGCKIVSVDQGYEDQEFLDAFNLESTQIKENSASTPITGLSKTSLNNKDRIMALLQSEDLTSSQISTKLGLSQQDTRTYLLRLKKENRIRVVAKRGRFNLYTAKPQAIDEKYIKKINALEYDLSYLLNLIEVKMRLKEEENFTPADTINLTWIRKRIIDKKEELQGRKQKNMEENSLQTAEVGARIKPIYHDVYDSKSESFFGQDRLKNVLDLIEKRENLTVFQYRDDLSEFQELKVAKGSQMYKLLDSNSIMLFFDPNRYQIWIWHGKNTSVRSKFLAAKLAPSIRDKFGKGIKLLAIDEGNETREFKLAIGLIQEVDSEFFGETKKPVPYVIRRAINTIVDIMNTESIDEITIPREYLLEIFDKSILKYSNDGYPMLVSRAQPYFLDAGIVINIFGNIIKFYKSKLYSKENGLLLVVCKYCGYKIAQPFPKDSLCPKCHKFLPDLFDLTKVKQDRPQPKEFETKTGTLSSRLRRKIKVKEKSPSISIERDIIQLKKGEYIKLLGITSVERTQLYCSNEDLRYLLELTNNLDFIATGVLGGELDKMHLISVETNTEEKCQFYVRDEIIYLAYGVFPDKKGKWLLDQMADNFSELIRDKDVNNLTKFETYQIQLEFKKRIKFILNEYNNLQQVFSDQKIPYSEDSIRIDYLGLSSMSIGVISLLIGDDLNIELQINVANPEDELEMRESMLTARIEAIAANTQGNIGSFPRWIAVKVGFEQYRFLTFKKYDNDYFLSLLSEGNLEKVSEVESLLDPLVKNETKEIFSGNLKPFNDLGIKLRNYLTKRRKFPPFNFYDGVDDKDLDAQKDAPEASAYCRYCGSKLRNTQGFCSNCGTKID